MGAFIRVLRKLWSIRADLAVVVTVSLALAAFTPSSTEAPPIGKHGSREVTGDPDGTVLRHILAGMNWKPRDVALDWQRLRQFYANRGYRPAWTSKDNSARAIQALIHSDEEGLSPTNYKGDEIRAPSGDDANALAHFDLLLTNSVLRYTHDARQGQISAEQAYADAALPKQRYDAVGDLNAALNNDTFGDYLAGLPPQQDGYRALHALLARYREIAAQGGWSTIPANVSFATRHMRRVLAQRLANEDADLSPDERNSDQIRQALMRFQSRHGLRASGELDPRTIQELDVNAATRVEEIALNMERWRWLPRDFGVRYVEVNVPSASLQIIDQGQAVLSSRVVVGREKDPTPLLHAEATSITINPSWQIPNKIAQTEILPKLLRHPSYLRKHHMVFAGGSRLKQLPGADNALGALKIDMPNRFEVYMHDTPGQAAFASDKRDESHGCMRVEQILPLASFALSGTTDQAVPDLEDAIAAMETQKIALPAPLPVYVVYWTVRASDDGAQFWPDVYGRDDQLREALKNQVAASHFTML
jgi:murein L,D-transpeptidase YcbB/YkuD